MDIRFINNLYGICWHRVSELIVSVGWPYRNPAELKQAFAKSSYIRFAYHNDNLVGFGRTVDDGKYYGMIVDLIVDPAFQGQGIGSTILCDLKAEMKGYYIISLTAAPEKLDFYHNQGWKKSNSAFHWPRSK